MKTKNKNILILFVLFFSIIFISSCKKKDKTGVKSTKGSVAFIVKTEKAEISSISEYFDYAGTVISYNTLIVLPEVPGRIKKLYKEIGDFVRKGELIFELEDTTYKAQYEQAKAMLESAKINLNDAKKNKNRIEAVYNKNGVSKAQYEKAISAYGLALNNSKRATAGFKLAKFQYDSTKIKAPFSGIITGKYKEEGDFINPSMGGFSQSTGVYTLEDYSKIYVDIDIPSSEAGFIKSGQKAEIILKNSSIEGKVLTVNEKTNPMTSAVSARIIANNKNKAVLPGTIVKIRIHYKEKRGCIVLPMKAVIDGNRVFIMKNNKAVERTVKIGFKNPNFVEIISGVKEGEKVITDGNFGLFTNAFVKEEQK